VIVAVASGKGGTGKTTVAVSLALAAVAEGNAPVALLDCDVESPDDALFLDAEFDRKQECGLPVPEVDAEVCNLCGRCTEVCEFHALTVLPDRVLVFPGLCHGCGSCVSNCPESAIRERLRVIGLLEAGHAGELAFARGTLRVGEAMATPVIRQLKQWQLNGRTRPQTIILDAPPGTACPVVETVRGADFALLVTEPTPFGLHDLEQAVDVIRDVLRIPVGVVINREMGSDPRVGDYCARAGVPILLRIPFDRRVAEAYSEGIPLIEAEPAYGQVFRTLLSSIAAEVDS